MSGFVVRHPEAKSGFVVRQPVCPKCGAKANELTPGPFGSRVPVIVNDGDRLSCLRCGHEWKRSQGH